MGRSPAGPAYAARGRAPAGRQSAGFQVAVALAAVAGPASTPSAKAWIARWTSLGGSFAAFGGGKVGFWIPEAPTFDALRQMHNDLGRSPALLADVKRIVIRQRART